MKAQPAEAPADVAERVVRAWFVESMTNNVVSRNTEVVNQVSSATEDLVARLRAALAPPTDD